MDERRDSGMSEKRDDRQGMTGPRTCDYCGENHAGAGEPVDCKCGATLDCSNGVCAECEGSKG